MFKGEEFIINFLEAQAFLTDAKSIAIDSLQLPLNITAFKAPAHWHCRIITYSPEARTIFAEVLHYQLEHVDFLPFQEEEIDLFEGLERIDFRGVDTNKLLITSKGLKEIIPFISKTPGNLWEEESNDHSMDEGALVLHAERFLTVHGNIAPAAKAKEIFIRTECHLAWKDLTFDFGSVSARCKVKKIAAPVEVRIYNEHLRVEFDAIKNYFGKILSAGKIKIKLTLRMHNGSVSNVYAYSPEIEKINPSVIEAIKFELVKGLPKKKFLTPVDKSLFTMDEYFQAAIDPTMNAGVFYNKESQFIEDVLKISSTRHYNNLRFLSEYHVYQIMKLRFILKPFSFVFLLEGKKAYHVVWETLDTEEATYVWHSDKNKEELKRTLRHIEEIIKAVKVQGKSVYIQSSEDLYHRIYHDYSSLVNGFIKWKGELENILY